MTVWLQATSGRGPAECEYALKGIFTQLEQESISQGLILNMLACEQTAHGMSSFIVSVEGANCDQFAVSWSGSTQWICKSPIRPTHQRKRWFVGLSVIGITPSTINTVQDCDLVWESMKASGPGGQHVNKTESAVRLTHKPSGVVVTAQEERSQHRNKSLALAKLHAELQRVANAQAASNAKDRWNNHNSLERGNPIRTYTGMDFKKTG